MEFSARMKNLCILLFASGVFFLSYSLTGRVIDINGSGIEGAFVELVSAALSATSGTDGAWTIPVVGGIPPILRNRLLPVPVLRGATLHFVVGDDDENVGISVHALDGRFMYDAVNRKLAAGFYRLNPLDRSLGAGMYALRVRIGAETAHLRLPVLRGMNTRGISLSNATGTASAGRLEKRTVVIDTVRVSKAGYASAVRPVSSYEDSITITLDTLAPAYHLPPPHPCYNRFNVENCIKGDPNSACGGNCTVANSCSPPESQDKASLPKTFICPRFMLFSTEMLQAAKDDAKLYGWGDNEDPPFNYAVVGHDPDVGGLDDVQSSCCQCYQIIYVKPEPSSPQPPELPYPKPLIVQSFNTAASGPKGFDVFMGAGGYGAFNACYDDPAFGNTSNFDEFIYDGYPYQNPGGGGISFLRYPEECLEGWPPTVEAVQSSECQDKIKQLCDQALVKSSTQITEDTRRSCIETNKVESLYHQNWEVMVKRVRCPDNLSRVTGCRLKEEKLPLPHPEVQTPADAKANGTFREGYHTTTMQDCCKPTCAWADWVVGPNYKLPADGEWNSFYSCDKNGVPITKP
ncbi:MAG: carboxypeptidase regulatory-like domain-containing protein [Chitinispirillaceae bacterium]|nr:carboxypeptidase regulatory-like domain-containing protein [Chitinispirillaceae bacterium]